MLPKVLPQEITIIHRTSPYNINNGYNDSQCHRGRNSVHLKSTEYNTTHHDNHGKRN
jgi:hypothetical protein